MASASRVFGNSWQTQPRTILSTAKNGTRLGRPLRSTMICCRNTRISASIAARGRNRSTIIPKIILQRSRIPQSIIRFCVSRQPDGIYDRDKSWPQPSHPYQQCPIRPAQPKTRRRTSRSDVELMTEKKVLSFKPAPRLEHVGDKHSKRMQDRKHRSECCDDSALRRESRPDDIFGKDNHLGRAKQARPEPCHHTSSARSTPRSRRRGGTRLKAMLS